MELNFDAKEVRELIKNNKFVEKYPKSKLFKNEKGYFIKFFEPVDENIFLFKEKKNIKLYLGDNTFETFEAESSDDIKKYIEQKGKDTKELYLRNKGETKYINILRELGNYLEISDLEFREKPNLEKLKLKEPLPDTKDYRPEEYSIYFYEYFIYEDEGKKNEEIMYEDNNTRQNIKDNLLALKTNENLKTYKLTGPTSIGKSFTLFRLSRLSYNIAYINLKILTKNKDDLFKSYNMIIEELERFDIENYIKDLEQLINECYKDNKSFLNLLVNIMNFLNDLELFSIFVLDEFKQKYIDDDFSIKTKKFNKIKIVYCSSINDKNIREECMKTWTIKGKNITILNEENQNYYFYYTNIYNFYKNNKNQEDKILLQFSFMPKYIFKYKKNNKSSKKLFDEAKNKIDSKLNEYCKFNNIEKSLLLFNIKYIMKNEINYDQFDTIIRFCPLKYFIIDFKIYSFKIYPIFPYLTKIINYKLNENECLEYFQKEIYKKNSIVNAYVKGDYFEAAAKYGLRKIILPMNQNCKTVMVNEIVSMDKIIDDEDDIDEDYDNYFSLLEQKKENDNALILHNKDNPIIKEKKQQKNIFKEINDNFLDNNKRENIEPNQNNEEEESIDEEEEDDDDEIDDVNNSDYIIINKNEEDNIDNQEKKSKIDNKEKYSLEKMLEDFKIKTLNNKSKFEGLSDDAISFLKNIEDYRADEINKQRKSNESFNKSEYNGDESIFIDQFSKWGKALDFAYIYGEKENKTFIGFQMKCYFENSKLNDSAINKRKIRKNCQKILVNSMKLFNCKITKWYYYLLFYLNKETKSENIDKINLDKCKNNNISYFFYDPLKQNFYLKNKKTEMVKLDIDSTADLDACVTNVLNSSLNFLKEGKIEIGSNINDMRSSFKKDFSKIFKDKNSILGILDKIKNNLKLKDYTICFFAQFKFQQFYFLPPDNKSIFLYKIKNENNFLAILRKNRETKSFEILNGKEKNTIFNLLDLDIKYYYCLKKKKRRKYKRIKFNSTPNEIICEKIPIISTQINNNL